MKCFVCSVPVMEYVKKIKVKSEIKVIIPYYPTFWSPVVGRFLKVIEQIGYQIKASDLAFTALGSFFASVHFWGILEGFPVFPLPHIVRFFSACHISDTAPVMLSRKHFCIDWIPHYYTKWLNICENERYEKWENDGYAGYYEKSWTSISVSVPCLTYSPGFANAKR